MLGLSQHPLAGCWLLAGCAHYQKTYFRVVDSVSQEPVAAAHLTTVFSLGALAFTDLFRPEWSYTQNQEAQTPSNGVVKLKVPMSRPSGMHPRGKNGNPVDPNTVVGATVTVAKAGYMARQVFYSNTRWREVGRSTSTTSPLLVELTRTNTDKALEPTRVGAFSSAIAVHASLSRAAQLVRRKGMFRALNKLFRKEEPTKAPFVDQVLGEFAFERNLGWKKQIVLGGKQAELVLGSDGEAPAEAMLQSARSWMDQWSSQHPKIIEYIRRELAGWSDEPNLPVPEKLEVESINLLWSDKPRTSMVYFHYPGDDIRCWHVTFDGFEPQGFAYDD